MSHKVLMVVGVLAAVVFWGSILPAAAVAAPPDKAALDQAFELLKTYDWGQDRKPLVVIEQAVVGVGGDAATQKDLEARLLAVLRSDAKRGAKDFAFRQLSLIASADAVPTVAALLPDKDLSHMARYVLERMPGPEAVQAMREALPKTSGLAKVGVINSLGVRADAQSAAALAALLKDADELVAGAAAAALGAIGTPEAAQALEGFQKAAPAKLQLVAADAYLLCADRLLAAGKKAEAAAIYKTMSAATQPKHVRMAAMRGLLATTGVKSEKN